jgi:serine/threonine-protein kinase
VNAERHQRVMQLFQQVLDRQGPDRGAFLQTACGTDDTLRDDVESLLAHHDSRTIMPARKVSDASTDDSVQAIGSPVGQLVRQGLRPANWDRFRISLFALVLALLLSAIGYRVKSNVDRVLRNNLAHQLQATLDSNVAAVTNWLKLQQHLLRDWAQHPLLREEFPALVRLAQASDTTVEALRDSQPHLVLLELMTPLLESDDVLAINGSDTEGLLVFTSRDTLRERYRLTSQGTRLIAPVFLGQEILLPPILGRTLVENEVPGVVDEPIILVGSPVRGDQNRIVGGLFASIDAGREFARLLSLGRAGERGANFAFGMKGQLLAGSEGDESSSTQHPLVKIAAAAMSAPDEIHMFLEGYRDHRGVYVVGASKWLEDYGFGIVSEIEFEAAYAASRHVSRLLASLFALLMLASVVAFCSSLSAVRWRREVNQARQLGQYTLETLIGEGGMGKVYKARHATLRRPTAVKVLDGQRTGPSAIARFEREAQLASSLTHPNTVEIYDYGRSADDTFYLAMEYLPGLTFDSLVKRHGAIGTARMLYLYRQVLGSIAEAHQLRLIHRDIKPANIILCRRGGDWDFVKVVDFGLAKDLGFKLAPKITQTGLISGTPLYIAPECLDDPENYSRQSDIYALGVVAFYLLTGRDLFDGNNAFELFQHVLHEKPPHIAELNPDVPAELDELIVRCIAKQPAERPSSVEEILGVVQSLAVSRIWTQSDAQTWWQEHEPQLTMSTSGGLDQAMNPQNSRSLNT